MSTSEKTPASIRQGGPGAAHENAKAPLKVEKPAADDGRRSRSRSRVSGGGGEADAHHTHDAEKKGGGSRPA